MPFVLDCSLALAWALPDEDHPGAETLSEKLESDYALAPAIWPLEFANALLMAQRRQRITQAETQRILAWFGDLPITLDAMDYTRAANEVLPLARKYALTTYDAAYLELALRLKLPLATLDAKLAAACKKTGVPVLS
jgi:predicted nucleic acid-binding protein